MEVLSPTNPFWLAVFAVFPAGPQPRVPRGSVPRWPQLPAPDGSVPRRTSTTSSGSQSQRSPPDNAQATSTYLRSLLTCLGLTAPLNFPVPRAGA